MFLRALFRFALADSIASQMSRFPDVMPFVKETLIMNTSHVAVG